MCTSSPSPRLAQLSLAFSWNTARCGITCATVYDNGTIILGYQSGYLEAWSLASSGSNGRIVANLLWRGSFSSHSPIRSVAPMAKPKGQPNDEPGKSASQDSLLVTIQPETRRSGTARGALGPTGGWHGNH
jgi:hypothetical protein